MKRQRKKYLKPSHPWERDRIDAENKLLHRYGLLQKEEIWKTETLLRNLRRQARHLLATPGPQAELESKQLLARLHRLGLVGKDATLDDVLSLSIENLLERRLQTIVHRKGLARTPRQARQLVLHGHVTIAGRRVSTPSYLVPLEEEGAISFVEGSPFKEQQKPPEAPAAGSDVEVERGTEESPKEEVG